MKGSIPTDRNKKSVDPGKESLGRVRILPYLLPWSLAKSREIRGSEYSVNETS